MLATTLARKGSQLPSASQRRQPLASSNATVGESSARVGLLQVELVAVRGSVRDFEPAHHRASGVLRVVDTQLPVDLAAGQGSVDRLGVGE